MTNLLIFEVFKCFVKLFIFYGFYFAQMSQLLTIHYRISCSCYDIVSIFFFK